MFYLINSDIGYKRIAAIDNHLQSYNWTEDMATPEGGSFEIVLSDGALMNVLEKELFVQNTKCSKLGFITTIQCKKDKGVIREIKIKGKMAEYILTRRHVKTQMQLQGNAKQIITDLITVNVINTKSTILNIPMKLNFIGSIPSDVLEYGFEDGKKVSDALKEICTNLNLFYYFTIENGELVLNIKSCEDKSYMIFASDDSNLSEVTIYDTIENKANCVVVKGDIINSSVPYSYSVLQGKTGIHVSEDFIDSSDFDSKDVESSLYLKMLQKKGNNKLMSYQIMRLFDSCTIKNKYTYPDEISLGDVVTVDIDGERQRQRLVSFLHCKNSNNKEEYIFTLAQMPVVLTATDEEYILEDVPKEDLPEKESDVTNPNINSDSKVDGIEIVGRVLCIDNDKVDGTIQKLKDGLYRVNIFTWNENPETSITDETTGETAITIEQKPFSGKIYFACPFNILSYLGNSTLDIDNFDNSKTRIDITTAKKGVLYEDYYDPGVYLFENITEENADDTLYYEYDIVSENLNFNFSSIISIESVKSTIPAKKYGKTYPTTLASISRPSGYGDTVRHADFQPANFYADDGDYIKFYGDFAPIIHTSDPQHPYEIGEEQTGVEIYWNFTNGEIVADKRIRWTEGYYFCYDFNNGYGIHTNFKKINYLKETQSNYRWVGYYGQAELMHQDDDGNYFDSRVNGICIIKQDPAFDNIEGLNEITWICCKPVAGTKTPDLASQLSMPRILFHTDIGKYRFESLADPSGSLEKLCKDPATWQSILDEQASEEEETTTE